MKTFIMALFGLMLMAMPTRAQDKLAQQPPQPYFYFYFQSYHQYYYQRYPYISPYVVYPRYYYHPRYYAVNPYYPYNRIPYGYPRIR